MIPEKIRRETTVGEKPGRRKLNCWSSDDDGSLRCDDGSKRLDRLENVFFHSLK